ncbi:hypothetical protein L596_029350 [Steinernema carpocapsae]|uniref:Cytochrome P450 n=1 Tax=Steinernema carpocapsae TaxID=34508 RepID=A0A4U5LUD6_STECR|nr:hypothetical protein L596_029350 [Steinernema carpocapsae]
MPCFYVFLAIFVLLKTWLNRKRQKLPPGPTPLPLVGNMHLFFIGKLRGKSNVDLTIDWKKRYGNVYTVWIGPTPVVFVCDYKTAIDAFVKNGDAHAARQDCFSMREPRGGNKGLIFADGPGWREQKRFALVTLRNFGMGRNIMQQRILEEANYRFENLNEEIANNKGATVINPEPFFELLIGSIINQLMAGYRYDETNSEEFLTLKRCFRVVLEEFTPIDFLMFSKKTYQLPLFKQRWNRVIDPIAQVRRVMKRQIEERKQKIAENQHVLNLYEGGDDFIDAYLVEMEKRKMNGEEMGSFSDENLETVLLDLWIAGSDTTIAATVWGMVFMLNDSKIQDLVRDEVHMVTKGNRPVELSDKTSLSYTNAVITEIFRCSCILNINLFHATCFDTVVGDYLIPKGTAITPQLSTILNDDSEFVDSGKFIPERYLENKKLEQQVIPFSIGKRSCLGEGLARAELFLILTNFFQNFKVSVPEGCDPPSVEQIALDGTLKRSRPFKIKVEKAQFV